MFKLNNLYLCTTPSSLYFNSRTVIKGNENDPSKPKRNREFTSEEIPPESGKPFKPFRAQHSNSFVDLNKDYTAGKY